eukprot:Nk52_evm5s225 gene=Nk52_evmTU5s225
MGNLSLVITILIVTISCVVLLSFDFKKYSSPAKDSLKDSLPPSYSQSFGVPFKNPTNPTLNAKKCNGKGTITTEKDASTCIPCDYEQSICDFSQALLTREASDSQVTDKIAPELAHVENLFQRYLDVYYMGSKNTARTAFAMLMGSSAITMKATTRAASSTVRTAKNSLVYKVTMPLDLIKGAGGKFFEQKMKHFVEEGFQVGMTLSEIKQIRLSEEFLKKHRVGKLMAFLGYCGKVIGFVRTIQEIFEEDTTYKRVAVDIEVNDGRVEYYDMYSKIIQEIEAEEAVQRRSLSSFFKSLRADARRYLEHFKPSIMESFAGDTPEESMANLAALSSPFSSPSLFLEQVAKVKSSEQTLLKLLRQGMLYLSIETVVPSGPDSQRNLCESLKVPHLVIDCPSPKKDTSAQVTTNTINVYFTNSGGQALSGALVKDLWDGMRSPFLKRMIDLRDTGDKEVKFIDILRKAIVAFLYSEKVDDYRKENLSFTGKDDEERFISIGNMLIRISAIRTCSCLTAVDTLPQNASDKLKSNEIGLCLLGRQTGSTSKTSPLWHSVNVQCMGSAQQPSQSEPGKLLPIRFQGRSDETSKSRILNIITTLWNGDKVTWFTQEGRLYRSDIAGGIPFLTFEKDVDMIFEEEGYLFVTLAENNADVYYFPLTYTCNGHACLKRLTSASECLAASNVPNIYSMFQSSPVEAGDIGRVSTVCAGIVPQSLDSSSKGTLHVLLGTTKGYIARFVESDDAMLRCPDAVYRVGAYAHFDEYHVLKIFGNFQYYHYLPNAFVAVVKEAYVYLAHLDETTNLKKLSLFSSLNEKVKAMKEGYGDDGRQRYPGDDDLKYKAAQSPDSFNGLYRNKITPSMMDGKWFLLGPEDFKEHGSHSPNSRALDFRFVSQTWYLSDYSVVWSAGYSAITKTGFYFVAPLIFSLQIPFYMELKRDSDSKPISVSLNTENEKHAKCIPTFHPGPISCEGTWRNDMRYRRSNAIKKSETAHHWNCNGVLKSKGVDDFPNFDNLASSCEMNWLSSTFIRPVPSIACLSVNYMFVFDSERRLWYPQKHVAQHLDEGPNVHVLQALYSDTQLMRYVIAGPSFWLACNLQKCQAFSLKNQDEALSLDTLNLKPVWSWNHGTPDVVHSYTNGNSIVKFTAGYLSSNLYSSSFPISKQDAWEAEGSDTPLPLATTSHAQDCTSGTCAPCGYDEHFQYLNRMCFSKIPHCSQQYGYLCDQCSHPYTVSQRNASVCINCYNEFDHSCLVYSKSDCRLIEYNGSEGVKVKCYNALKLNSSTATIKKADCQSPRLHEKFSTNVILFLPWSDHILCNHVVVVEPDESFLYFVHVDQSTAGRACRVIASESPQNVETLLSSKSLKEQTLSIECSFDMYSDATDTVKQRIVHLPQIIKNLALSVQMNERSPSQTTLTPDKEIANAYHVSYKWINRLNYFAVLEIPSISPGMGYAEVTMPHNVEHDLYRTFQLRVRNYRDGLVTTLDLETCLNFNPEKLSEISVLRVKDTLDITCRCVKSKQLAGYYENENVCLKVEPLTSCSCPDCSEQSVQDGDVVCGDPPSIRDTSIRGNYLQHCIPWPYLKRNKRTSKWIDSQDILHARCFPSRGIAFPEDYFMFEHLTLNVGDCLRFKENVQISPKKVLRVDYNALENRLECQPAPKGGKGCVNGGSHNTTTQKCECIEEFYGDTCEKCDRYAFYVTGHCTSLW